MTRLCETQLAVYGMYVAVYIIQLKLMSGKYLIPVINSLVLTRQLVTTTRVSKHIMNDNINYLRTIEIRGDIIKLRIAL